MKKTIALIGNPNSGKTTIFNMLTGTYQKVGNWTGVTTESKQGRFRWDKNISIVDLPGIYSLNATSPDEVVVVDYLKKNKPDFIVNVIDVNLLERSLSLTIALKSLQIPIYVVLTHKEQFIKSGKDIDLTKLSARLNLPISFICKPKKERTLDFVQRIVKMDKNAFRGSFEAKSIKNLTESKLDGIITYNRESKRTLWDRIDQISTSKYFGLPMFFCVMFAVYFLTIKIGGIGSSIIGGAFNSFGETTKNFLTEKNAPSWTISLICEAIIGGFSTVISFLPQILVLFALIGIIEQSGYATRVAFILDKIFKGVSLSGKSIMPLVACAGCTATGLMCTRSIESTSDRRATIILAPFMPCGAKTAVFGWISYEFFNGNPFIATSMYFIALLSVGFFGIVIKKLGVLNRGQDCFALEMPRLTTPRLRDILLSLKEKSKDFLGKAALIVFLVSVVVWALKNLGFNGYTNGKVEESFIFYIGRSISWIFYPLGFGSWECSVAILSETFAKEAIIETLKILSANGNELFRNGYVLYAFMTFILLSPPCIVSIMTTYRELKSKKRLAFSLSFQFLSAYLVAMMINLCGILSEINSCLPFLLIGVIIIVIKVITKRNKLWGKNIKRNTI